MTGAANRSAPLLAESSPNISSGMCCTGGGVLGRIAACGGELRPAGVSPNSALASPKRSAGIGCTTYDCVAAGAAGSLSSTPNRAAAERTGEGSRFAACGNPALAAIVADLRGVRPNEATSEVECENSRKKICERKMGKLLALVIEQKVKIAPKEHLL